MRHHKRKILLILFYFLYAAFQQAYLLPDRTIAAKGKIKGSEKENRLRYRFEYTFQGKATGVILFFFRYRMFFYATASVLLDAQETDEKGLQFNFVDIAKTGYLLRTWGFGGKTLITGAADYDLEKARAILEKDSLIIKEKAPDFSHVIKRWKVFPFRILTRGENVLTFKRDITGRHRDCSLDMKLKSLQYDRKYDFYFRIYHMLLEMVKIYNHRFFPGDWREISQLEPGMKWQSPAMDYTGNMNRIGTHATDIVGKFLTFKQEKPFRLTYRVVSRTPGMLIVKGEALPRVKIWDGYRITQVTRTIDIRLPDGIVLNDRFHMEISKTKGKGGFARCALTLIQ
jgi:hypothetical protein